MTFLWASLFVIVVLVFWLLNLVGLPGNWLIAAATAVYAWLMPGDSRVAIGWPVVVVIAGLAVVGELAELAAGAAGVRRAGGSRRAALLALAGSVAGGIIGAIVGVPIPVVGPLVAAVLFGAGGALVGAMLGEHTRGRPVHMSWHVGTAAFRGRLWGTLAKAVIGAIMAGVAIVAVFV
jgi:uncharacterized protein YqgC (DUF456 family)